MLKELKKRKKPKVFVAMSGGVDSSVAALLLKKQGYQVVGVFMKFWAGVGANENSCCSLEARRDAMGVCAVLNIPFLTWDFRKEFKKAVVDDFISGYKKGITPNPCVICNKEIKFGLFFKKAIKMGADYAATGHYIRLRRKTPNFKFQTPNSRLFIAKDKNKDQSYFLWTLTQEQLKYCLFPIGDYTKDEVRALAKKYKLPVALKKESQEVCFVYDRDLSGFLKKYIQPRKGTIVELKSGKKIGEHQGVQFYTIGQRAPIGGTGPYYVVDKNLNKNQLMVIKKDNKNSIYKELTLKDANWISGQPPKSAKILVRTRYRQPLVKCRAPSINRVSGIKVVFEKPQIFVAPGQSAVFYGKNKELLGGGVII